MSTTPQLVVLGSSSPFTGEARALADRGRCHLELLPPGSGPLRVATTAADRALVGTSAPLFFLKDLLRRCRAGRLGNVRLLLDGGVPPAERVGFRERPWLAEILAPAGTAVPWADPLPAPLHEVRTLDEALAGWPAAKVRFAPVPSPFPAELQVETTTVCRMGCPHCPHDLLDRPDAFMDEGLFADVVAQCRDGRPDNLELYLNGEPLEDPRLPRLARLARDACPSSLVSVTTHVDALTEARAHTLAGTGLDLVFVSLNPLGGLDQAWLEPRLQRLVRIAELLDNASMRLVVVTLVNLIPVGQRGQFRRLLAHHRLPFEAFTATGRAGDVELDRFVAPGPTPPPSPCERAFTRAFVRHDGEMVLCCEDFRHRRTFGSVRDRPIAEIWTGEAYQSARRDLLDGRPGPPCDRCEMGRPAARHGRGGGAES